ncbi:MBL fold metallo-hydrolase [Streptomyces sp. NPDC004539]|uniref:MBL fold metallo-hydrolase n=1 Tax=Streptomyces sp. NPDC004539 TaxID=3154280 RepID=UPI0033B4E5E5
MSDVRVIHIGGPTVLIEVGGWRLLTDPTFDAPGRRYAFGWGTSSVKTAGPALSVSQLPPLDAVLLTHDHHADNLDDSGRALLPTAGVVLTTPSGAGRLGGNARGLAPWETWRLSAPGRPSIEVIATPARHGPPLSRPFVGDVTGFALRWPGQQHGALWISGDTVLFDGVREVARRVQVGTALLHLGGVRFPLTGPVRYTLTASAALRVCRVVRPRVVVPVHYEGWSHFVEGRRGVEAAVGRASGGALPEFVWVPRGEGVGVVV